MRHYETKTTVDQTLTRITCSACDTQRTFALPDAWVTIQWPCHGNADNPNAWSIDLCPDCADSLLPNLASLKPAPAPTTTPNT